MLGFYITLGLVAIYCGSYVVHSFRQRAFAAGTWGLLVFALPVLCIVWLLMES